MQIGTIASVLFLFIKLTTVMPFLLFCHMWFFTCQIIMLLLISKGVVYLLLPSGNDGFTQNLYNINVRKVILMGLPPVGCAPHFLWEYGSQNGKCIEYINNVVIEFNYALRYMSSEFIRQHPDSMISYCDTFEGSVDILENRDRYGEQMHHKYYILIACCP